MFSPYQDNLKNVSLYDQNSEINYTCFAKIINSNFFFNFYITYTLAYTKLKGWGLIGSDWWGKWVSKMHETFSIDNSGDEWVIQLGILGQFSLNGAGIV